MTRTQNASTAKPLKKPDAFFENNKKCEEVLQVFSIFSNRYRFKILCVLKEGDYCVNEIVQQVGGKFSNVSQQLKMLTLAGYLTKKRVKKSVYYHLKDKKVKELLKFLCRNYA